MSFCNEPPSNSNSFSLDGECGLGGDVVGDECGLRGYGDCAPGDDILAVRLRFRFSICRVDEKRCVRASASMTLFAGTRSSRQSKGLYGNL